MNVTIPFPVGSLRLRCTDYEAITVSTVAIGLTTALRKTAHLAWIRVEGATVRVRLDGTNPTAAVGMPMYDTEQYVLTGDELAAFKAIRKDAVDATVHVHYFRPWTATA